MRRARTTEMDAGATGDAAAARTAARLSDRPESRRWRLVVTEPAPGDWNMAVDEAMAHAHRDGEAPPTLRFYGWRPPALSLGYFQSVREEVDVEALRAAGVDLVRRPTGGRAILHDREVTYSVVISADLLPGDVISTYRTLAAGLLAGLRRLGAPAELSGGPPPGAPVAAGGEGSACFDTPSWYEVVAGGRKLAGSAQTRQGGVILQHGAIPIRLDAAALFGLLKVAPDARPRLAAALERKATDLAAALGREPAAAEVQEALAAGFAEALGLELVSAPLTPGERALAEELRRTKYGHPDWTMRR